MPKRHKADRGTAVLKTHHITAGDYAEIHALADANQMAIFALWDRQGNPSGAIRELAGDAEPGRLLAFKLIPPVGTTVSQFRWVDQQQSGVGGNDWTSVIQHLASVDRPTAARWLRDYLDREIASRQPMTRQEVAVQRKPIKTA